MNYDTNHLASLKHLKTLAEKIKSTLEPVSASANAALKSVKAEGNTVHFYTSADQSGNPAFSFDFPAELFLDQAKTVFAGSFAWSEEKYPGSADPGLEGMPVMVLAVKGEGGSVAYSFLDMAALVDTYKAKTDGKDASTTVSVSGYEIDVRVNVSAAEGNQLQARGDGLYVPAPAVPEFSASIGTVTAADAPYAGAAVGDKYLDLVFKRSRYTEIAGVPSAPSASVQRVKVSGINVADLTDGAVFKINGSSLTLRVQESENAVEWDGDARTSGVMYVQAGNLLSSGVTNGSVACALSTVLKDTGVSGYVVHVNGKGETADIVISENPGEAAGELPSLSVLLPAAGTHAYLPASEFSAVRIDAANANGLSVGPDGLGLSAAAAGAAGAMSAADKAKLDGMELATDIEVSQMLIDVFSGGLGGDTDSGGGSDVTRPPSAS